MPEQQKPTGQPEQQKPAKPAEAPLGAAGESSNPDVHQVLAELEIAERNGDKDAVKDLRERLAGLGVE